MNDEEMRRAHEPDRFAVDRGLALKHFVAWARAPFTAEGPSHLARARFAAGGPGQARKVRRMLGHETGRRILRERPNLAVALADAEQLEALPAGRFGRAYHAAMSRPGVAPSYLLSSLMYRDETFDGLDWSDEMKYLMDREQQTHDLTHLLSGYGTDPLSEAINVAFLIGLGGARARAVRALTWSSKLRARPLVTLRTWRATMLEAHARGRACAQTIPFYCIYWEELLPLPLDEVRRQLGVPPLRSPIEPSRWLSPRSRVPAEDLDYADLRALAEALGGAHADPRDIAALFDLDPAETQHALDHVRAGGPAAMLRTLARLPARNRECWQRTPPKPPC